MPEKMPLSWLPRLPLALFALPVGLFALAGAWRRAAAVLNAPAASTLGLVMAVAATALLLLLLALAAAKRARHPAAWQAEQQHPVGGSLVALGPVATMMAVVYWGTPGQAAWLVLLAVALAVQAWIVVRSLRALWRGATPPALVTPALYLPPVAGGLVGAMALATVGAPAPAAAVLWLLAAVAWAVLEWRVARRLLQGPLPEPVRPTIGVEAAPWLVGTLSASVVWPQLPGWVLLSGVALALLPVALVLARRSDWTAVPFSAGFWSFSFPLAAWASDTMEVVRRNTLPAETGWAALALATLGVGYLVIRTLALLVQGRLLPPVPVPPKP